MQVSVVFLYATTMYYQIICQISHSLTTMQNIRQNFLVLLRSDVTPNVKCLYLCKPWCVTNVISRDLSSSSTWCKPHSRSSFEKTVEPLRLYKTSSIVGMGCLSLSDAEFALRMSMQIRICLRDNNQRRHPLSWVV